MSSVFIAIFLVSFFTFSALAAIAYLFPDNNIND